jgi:subtilisin
MAKGKKVTNEQSEPDPGSPPASIIDFVGDGVSGQTTGRFIVVFKDEAAANSQTLKSTLNDLAGLRAGPSSADYEGGGIAAADLDTEDFVLFNQLGIGVISGEEAFQSLSASISDSDSPILAIEPEYVAYLTNGLGNEPPLEYLRGYRDAINHLYEQLTSGEMPLGVGTKLSSLFQDTSQFTWGLQATGVNTSRYSGQGINVAILDTGLDLGHPDFSGRAIQAKAFVTGVTADDVNGHGTHCVGTTCGSKSPSTGVRRYGIAYDAQIFVGKVFDNQPRPSAPTRSVIAGIEWAVTQGCQIASLSLGVPVNQKIQQYEAPIRRALRAGTLVIAAAGNNANRPTNPGFVEPPANVDDAIAVAALDNQLQIAQFSARSSLTTGQAGKVNMAGPGVSVFSSFPRTRGSHAFLNGTSMATPHVAGIAALWAEATGERGQALWLRLEQSALALSIASADVGAGFVQAPQ